MIINKPYALYYNGEIIGLITNPDPYDGNSIVEDLSPDEGVCDSRELDPKNKHAWNLIQEGLKLLNVEETIPTETDDEEED